MELSQAMWEIIPLSNMIPWIPWFAVNKDLRTMKGIPSDGMYRNTHLSSK